MHRRIFRALVTACAVMAASTLGISAASAASDSGWVPDGPYPDATTTACGTTLTIHEVVNRVERRTREDHKGNTRIDFRGKYVVLVSAPTGRKVVLNNSGPYSISDFANGDEFVTVASPGLIFPVNAQEPAAFIAAGLPAVFYYTKGRLDLLTHKGVEKVVTKPANPVSICKLLH
jgi:hypothetical protein